ncbi:hypothetical protein D5086_029763 [Populus alba]|uniref:Uncharacterized protein n=1 Tax=Populus alba TaxID=43335 RepID=A0ACC4AUH3_POPAL
MVIVVVKQMREEGEPPLMAVEHECNPVEWALRKVFLVVAFAGTSLAENRHSYNFPWVLHCSGPRQKDTWCHRPDVCCCCRRRQKGPCR